MKKTVKYILSLAVAAALLFYAFRGVDWREFFVSLRSTNWWFVIVSMAAGVAALIFRAERWRLQLCRLNPGLQRGSIWHGSNIGNFCSIIIPGSGEFYRCAHVSKSVKGLPYDKVFGTIVMERSWDILSIGLLLILSLALSSGTLMPFMREKVIAPFVSRFDVSFALVAGIAAALVLVLSILTVTLRRRSKICAGICSLLRGVLDGFAAFGKMRGKGLFLLYTAGIWMMYILMMYFTVLAIPELGHLGFADSMFISAVGNIASVIPTPGNLGAYHYLVGMAFSSLYVPSEMNLGEPGAIGLLAATISHGAHAILLAILALDSWVRVSTKNKKLFKI